MSGIDYKYVFSILDDVLNLPLKKRGRRWTLPARINLESHSRKDKLVFFINRKGTITVMEQGGDSMNIFDFLVEHDPECHNALDAYRKLCSRDGFYMKMKNFYEKEYDVRKESKYVDVKYVYRLSDAEHWSRNNLYTYLRGVFGEDKVHNAFELYRVGCLGRDSVIFWYSDDDGNVCHDNRIRYGENGHRKKETHAYRKFTTADGFDHKGVFKPFSDTIGRDVVMCMVESEKTAIIASMAFGGECIWTACGGMNQLGYKLPKNVILFPDYDNKAISLWESKGLVARWWEYPVFSEGLEHNEDIGDAIIKNKDNINIKLFVEWIRKTKNC